MAIRLWTSAADDDAVRRGGLAQAGSTSSSQLVAWQGTAQASAGAAQGSPVQQYSSSHPYTACRNRVDGASSSLGPVRLRRSGAGSAARQVSPSGVPAQAARQAPLCIHRCRSSIACAGTAAAAGGAPWVDQHGSTPVHSPGFTVIRQRDGYTASA